MTPGEAGSGLVEWILFGFGVWIIVAIIGVWILPALRGRNPKQDWYKHKH